MVWTEETFQLVRDGIDAARECRTVNLPIDWEKKVAERSKKDSSRWQRGA